MEISKSALKRRKFKQEVYNRLCSETILKKIKPFLSGKKIALDVGGNVGHIAKFLSENSKEVYTFEPVEVVYKRLLETANKEDNIKVINVAVGKENGEADFFVDHLRLSNSGLFDLSDVKTSFKKDAKLSSVKVTVSTIDSFSFKNVGFIKIDVEGTELDVLKGASELIKKESPDLMIEIYEPFSKYPIEDIFEFVLSKGYSGYYYRRNNDSLVKISDVLGGADAVRNYHEQHDGDFFFTKKKIKI